MREIALLYRKSNLDPFIMGATKIYPGQNLLTDLRSCQFEFILFHSVVLSTYKHMLKAPVMCNYSEGCAFRRVIVVLSSDPLRGMLLLGQLPMCLIYQVKHACGTSSVRIPLKDSDDGVTLTHRNTYSDSGSGHVFVFTFKKFKDNFSVRLRLFVIEEQIC